MTKLQHKKPTQVSLTLQQLIEKINELCADDLFEDVSLVVMAIDYETEDMILCGNGCRKCAEEFIIHSNKLDKTKHNEESKA